MTAVEDTMPRPILRKSNNVFEKCVQATGKLYGESTSRFVVSTINETKYLLVIYDCDSNTIHTQSIPSIIKESQVKVYTSVINFYRHEDALRNY